MKKIVGCYFNFLRQPFFNSLNLFVNFLGGDYFSKLNFYKSKTVFYIYKRKIVFLKILNSLFKLVKISFDFSFKNFNFFSSSSFFYKKFFFFRVNGGFLKIEMPKKNILVESRFLSCRNGLTNKFINFLNRFLEFFNNNSFSFVVSRKFFLIYKSFKSICEFLFKKYKFNKGFVFLKYISFNSCKK